MPFLENPLTGGSNPDSRKSLIGRHSLPLFPECSNPWCTSGRLHLWRSRRTPVLEGGWLCCSECTRRRIHALITRELQGHSPPADTHAHRVPLGLILLAQGWISHEQLRKAVHAKRTGYPGRIGAWLMEHCGLEEHRVTQALSLQWSCPVFSGEPEPALLALSPIPRIFLDTLGLIPLRLTGSGLLFLAFEDHIDHSLVLAVERVTGRRIEAGLLNGRAFRQSHQRMLLAKFSRTRLVEGGDANTLSAALARVIERAQPVDARLVRVHQFFWLRMWNDHKKNSVGRHPSIDCPFEDVVCSITQFE
jgi:hypothetical protein